MIRRILTLTAISAATSAGAVALTGVVCAIAESEALKRVRPPRAVKPWLRGLR